MDPPSPRPFPHDPQAWTDWILIAAGLILLAACVPHYLEGDGAARFIDLDRLLTTGDLTAWSKYSIIGPLFALPLYGLGRLALDPAWWCARYNLVLLAAGIGVLHAALRPLMAPAARRCFLLLLVSASMFPAASRNFDGETFTTLLVLLGIVTLAAGHTLLPAVALVLGVANAPTAAAGLGLVCAVWALEKRRLRFLVLPAAAASLWLLENRLRRGGWLATGYEEDSGFRTVMPYSGVPGFSYPLFFGILSILLSFGKGLLFYAPGAFLGLGRTPLAPALRAVHRLCLCFAVGLVLVYARWWAWYGGFAWGPRFFLFVSALSCLVLAVRLRATEPSPPGRLLDLLALALSVCVGIDGALFHMQGLEICAEQNFALEALCWYTPEFSPLWHPFVAPRSMELREWCYIGYCVLVFVWLGWRRGRSLLGWAWGVLRHQLVGQPKEWRI